MCEALPQVAAINIKKTSGGSWSDRSILNAYTAHDRELLVEQIERIDPELIIACGTFDQLIWLLDLDVNLDHPLKAPVKYGDRPIWVVPASHPAARGKNESAYTELREKVARIPRFGRSPH